MNQLSSEYIAIGDIHGCSRTLEALLVELDKKYSHSVTYVFLGDYVDRGPDSRGVIESLIQFGKGHDCVFLRGNHDQVMLEALKNEEYADWQALGGQPTIDSYGGEFPASHIAFLEATQLYFDTEDYMFVHAGAPLTLSLEDGKDYPGAANYYLWGRGHLNRSALPWEKPLVFGHTPLKEPLISEQMIGIDTGCVYKRQGFGLLTAISLPDQILIQKECIDC